ncbi:MAG: methyltransferase domain-containing protein [Burkholderiales bacterium]|nr:methyltransferase domain-containing protein [Burkholderiales bacterium]
MSVDAAWSWFERWQATRDRLLASPRFQRWAAAFPLTRPIARRRARQLFDLCAGFVYTQILLACVRLRLFEILAERPQTTGELARRLSLSRESADRLLAAAAALRLVEKRGDDQFALGPLGAPMVGNAGLVAMVEHHSVLYGDLADPVALLRGEHRDTALSRYWTYASSDRPVELQADHVSAYTRLMAASQPLVAGEILDAYPLRRHHCLLDVGGGDGSFLVSAAQRAPDLRVILFDLPPVADRARTRFAAAGISDRATAVGGDFHADPLPTGADVISLIRVIHDHDDVQALSILESVRRALPPGGTLLLAEPLAGTRGAEPVGDAYFGFYLMAMGQGRPRTRAALEALLRLAGFRRPRWVRTRIPLQTGLLVARSAPDSPWR